MFREGARSGQKTLFYAERLSKAGNTADKGKEEADRKKNEKGEKGRAKLRRYGTMLHKKHVP